VIRWVTTADLIRDTYRLSRKLPPDVDIVVGMARSGLMPAALLASHLHLPLYAASSEHVVPVGGGWRPTMLRPRRKRVLLVDDTVCTGTTMGIVTPWVRVAFPQATVETAAVYATPETAHLLTYLFEQLPLPHYLEWNFFNSGYISAAAFDLDGLLFEDIAPEDDDDGPRYVAAIQAQRPLHLPRRQPIPAIVTARLEKYRDMTVDQLQRYGIAVVKLLMGPWKDSEERDWRSYAVVQWKAEQYTNSPLTLFVESDPRQAESIANFTGKPVLCPTAGRVFGVQ
jgi:hypothetical protein